MKKFVLVMLIAALLATPALAAGIEPGEREAYGLDGLEADMPDQVEEILGRTTVTDAMEPDSLFSRLWNGVSERLGEIVRSALKSAAVIVAVVILCSVAGSLWENEKPPDAVTLGGVLAISAAAVVDLGAFMGQGRETLISLSDLSTLLLPCLSTAAAAGGAVVSSAAKYAATALFMDALLMVAQRIILPMIYAYTAAVIADAAVGGNALSAAAGFLKWLCVTMMTVMVLAFTAYLALTGVVSGSADAVTTRLTKTAIQTVLPVVGSIVADAAGTVAAGAGIIRNAVGVLGMAAVICVCCVPFLRIGVQYILYKAAAGISGAVGDGRLVKLISGVGTAYGMLVALLGAGALMLFFSIFSLIKAVGV